MAHCNIIVQCIPLVSKRLTVHIRNISLLLKQVTRQKEELPSRNLLHLNSREHAGFTLYMKAITKTSLLVNTLPTNLLLN